MSTESEQQKCLFEWNQLNKHNAEREFARLLLDSVNQSSPVIDKFSQWLLAGTAATVALLISEMSSVVPFITLRGFKIAVVLLILSALLGLLAKRNAMLCQISLQMDANVRNGANSVLKQFDENSTEIQKRATELNIAIETELNYKKVVDELVEPMPWYVKKAAHRNAEKGFLDPNTNSKQTTKRLLRQGWYTLAQTVGYFFFVISVVYFANAA